MTSIILKLVKFKEINDTLGHQTGDQALIAFSECLKNSFGTKGFVGRIGGDEFAILLQGDDYEAREELLLKLKNRMREIADGDSAPEKLVSIAGGIGVFDNKIDDSVSDVFARADAAMYEDKTKMKENEL